VTERGFTMRELLTKARERYGAEAVRYKTRQELLEALELVSPAGAAEPVSAQANDPPLVVRNFFLPPGR
jgi:hypothetical protein